MDKKMTIGIIAIILVAIIGACIFFMTSDKNLEKDNDRTTTNENRNDGNSDSQTKIDGKVLVVYYSAQNHTKTVAEKIAKNLDADTFEITPVDKYTQDDLNWTNENSRVSREHDDESLRNVELKTTKVADWDDYDTVLIGYPIWWGVAAWPVNNFIKDNDFTGKTVIPFCTSSSSGLGESGKLLEKLAESGNWQTGERFRESASDSDIKSFTDSLK